MENKRKEPVIRDLDASDSEHLPTSVESLCLSCEEMGVTKLLLTRIPYFKEIIVSSFECPHCGFKNNGVQSAGVIQVNGIAIELKVGPTDLNRQVVKSTSAMVKIPELSFEIPAFTQQGELSTIEGILDRAHSSLAKDQPVRRALDPSAAEKIEALLAELLKYKEGKARFTLVIDDISGNSFVENPFAPGNDPEMTIKKYERSAAQNDSLGIGTSTNGEAVCDAEEEAKEEAPKEFDPTQEVMLFPTNCANCQNPATTNMKAVDIPFFKQVILMATNCEYCGQRTNEVKPGAGIEEKGCKMSLKLTDTTDLARDVLKSDTCTMRVPEIDFELESGTLGGRFTTLEGLFVSVKENLQQGHPFGLGDAPSGGEYYTSMHAFYDLLDKIIAGDRLDITVVLDDPAGNSYLQNVYAPDPDPNMTIEHYVRTREQNEGLGLSEELIKEHEENKKQEKQKEKTGS